MATFTESSNAVKKRESLATTDNITDAISTQSFDVAKEEGVVMQVVSTYGREPIPMDHSGIATEETVVV